MEGQGSSDWRCGEMLSTSLILLAIRVFINALHQEPRFENRPGNISNYISMVGIQLAPLFNLQNES